VAALKDDLLERWREDAAIRGMSPETIKKYSWDIKQFINFSESKGKAVLAADRTLLRAWVDELRKRGNKTQTIQHSLASISSFYEYYIYEELIETNPVTPVRKRYLACYKIDSERESRQNISVEQASRIVDTFMDPRDRAIMGVFFKTGVRRKELLAMDIDDINWKNNSILLKPTKKRTNRLVFFDEETAILLRRWIAVRESRNRNGSRALFISTWGKRLDRGAIGYLIQKAAIKVGLHNPESDRLENHFSAHCCRHWFTTHLYRAGMSREHIMFLRGDAPLSAFDGYNHINPDDVRKSYLAHIPQLGV
jgi:integrase/recombinase XerD